MMKNNTTVLDAVFDLERDARKNADHYAFRVGYLEGALKHLISSGMTEGVKVTNTAAYDKWVAKLLAQCEKDAQKLAPRC